MFFRFSKPHFWDSEGDFGAVLRAILGRGIAFCVGGVHFFCNFLASLKSISKSAQGPLGSPQEGLEMMRFQSSLGGLLRGVKMSISLQRRATFGPAEGPEMRPKRAEKVVFKTPKRSEKPILGPWNFKKHMRKF